MLGGIDDLYCLIKRSFHNMWDKLNNSVLFVIIILKSCSIIHLFGNVINGEQNYNLFNLN